MNRPLQWDEFVGRRNAYLLALREPILACVQRRETGHPVFCGCVDWHSAVHGVFALLRIHRVTGEEECLRVAERLLESGGIELEQVEVAAGKRAEEVPYGFAWLLLLAQEYQEVTGRSTLVPLSEVVAEQLRAWVLDCSDREVVRYTRCADYNNLSWAILNLWQWSVATQRHALRLTLEGFALTRMMVRTAQGHGMNDARRRGFFPPALLWASAVVRLCGAERAIPQLTGVMSQGKALRPLRSARVAHHAGLNFSRSWGLWELFAASGDTDFRDLYVAHIVTQMDHPEYWAGDYIYSHWVAQFGVLGISLSALPGH